MRSSNRKFKTSATLAAALCAAAALCGLPAFAQEKPAPRLDQLKATKLSVDTSKQQQIWAAVMKTVGAHDPKANCWTLETRSRRFCMQPAKFAMRSANDKSDYYFAISGKDYQANALKTGVVMFMHFATTPDEKSFILRELDGLYEFGTRQAPAEEKNFRFIEVAIDTYAWEVTDHFRVNGLDQEMTTLIHVGGVFTPKQKRMADFISYKGNEQSCGAGQSDCVSNRVDYSFRPGAGGLHALELTLRRKIGGRKIFALDDSSQAVRSEPFVVRFDAKEGRYAIPSEDMVEWLGRRLPAKLAAQP